MGVNNRAETRTEASPLLASVADYGTNSAEPLDRYNTREGELFDNVPKDKRRLGTLSACFLIFNRVIGTGIFATPSNILRSAGSVGVALIMWLFGSIVAILGIAVYIELGTGLPRSGGEKNYLEFIYRRPQFLITCVFSVYAMITGSAAANSVVLSEFRDGYEKPNNFHWDKFWEGSGTDVNAFVAGLYAVIWSFTGYSNANNVLSEIKDPVRTIKRAGPIAILGVSAVYMLINVAYFAVVSKNDILNSRRIVAALYFRNLYGPTTERALSAFIALSTFGSLLAGQFAQGRVMQELGREGILPFASLFASSKPFNAPFAGLILQYSVSILFLFAIPPGDAYLFLISLASYCTTIINALVAIGVLLLHTKAYQATWHWDPPFRSPKVVVIVFFTANMFLIFAPLMPPVSGSKTYENLPYWVSEQIFYTPVSRISKLTFLATQSHSLAAFAVSLLGMTYWYIWGTWLPKRRGYRLERCYTLQEDGISRWVFRKVAIE
ncbi:hypothetical protein NP233_g8789 [Leucocoprinus birnbaumii]|uniref:High-affinity methionine permease n=1 Tax=Leucocoprinus birnbaumii TaxID=56174 RepID=A0AAD5VS67_9AGAR|nr:hypothetical protein NP233_g8789 [Leucocoprinus birnbaumii]